MQWTDIVNYPGDEDQPAERNWRKRLGKVQLLCPYEFKWFNVPKDIKFDDNGYASDQIYHFCDNDEHEGWTLLAHLVGWGDKK